MVHDSVNVCYISPYEKEQLSDDESVNLLFLLKKI